MTGRDRIVVIVVGVLVAIAASWMLVISPKRDQASKLQGQISNIQSSLSSAQSQVSAGEVAQKAFRNSYATMVRLGEAVPTDDNVPSLIVQIQSAAKATGVDFRGLTLNPAGPGGAPVPTTPAPTGATGASGATGATGTPAATGTTPTIGSSTGALPPGAAVGPAGFPIEPFTFTFQGNFFHLARFFGRLDAFVVADNKRVAVSGRLLSLDAISLAPGSAGFPQIAATVSATTYLLPTSQGLLAGATPSGPAAGTSQPVSSPGSPSPSPSPSSTSTPPAAVVAPVSAK